MKLKMQTKTANIYIKKNKNERQKEPVWLQTNTFWQQVLTLSRHNKNIN